MAYGPGSQEYAKKFASGVHKQGCYGFENTAVKPDVCLNCHARIVARHGQPLSRPQACQAEVKAPTGQPDLSSPTHHKHARHS